MNIESIDRIIWMAKMSGAYSAMPESERAVLAEWEKENLGNLATSDWPGWEKFIGAPPWKNRELFRSEKPKAGFIYVLKSISGLYKIGQTVNVKSRMASYATHSAEALELVALFPVSDMSGAEKWLHMRFSARQEHREWFRLSDDDLSAILRDGIPP